jgi:dienelactone hydrolase
MRRAVLLLFALCLLPVLRTDAAAQSAQPPLSEGAASVESLRLSYYDYDPALPLQPELKGMPEKNERQAALRTRYRLTYDSAHDQRVTAILSIPKRFSPPYPAVVLLHGSGGHKDTDYVRIAADMFATLGYAALSIDGQYRGERARPGRSGDIHLINSSTNRDAWVQTVIDLRRAVDYLHSRDDIQKSKIGFLGFSQGGMIGGTFIGVEPRIAVACLAIAGGNFVEWAKTAGFWKPEQARTVEVNAAITDPIHFIGRFGSRPLLMLNAKRDELIPRANAEALFNAARDPKEIIWYNSGHVLPLNAVNDIKAFFVKHLGERKAASR